MSSGEQIRRIFGIAKIVIEIKNRAVVQCSMLLFAIEAQYFLCFPLSIQSLFHSKIEPILVDLHFQADFSLLLFWGFILAVLRTEKRALGIGQRQLHVRAKVFS